MKRQIVLDTETTGLSTADGHRIIEIGAVEMIGRRITGRHYHQYIRPMRKIDRGALAVHGISNAFLRDKPAFADIADAFLDFVGDGELIIHNAAFDMGFLNYELKLCKRFHPLEQRCPVVDTLQIARQRYRNARNSLDALCKRFKIDNSHRTLHGALLDAEILAEVYIHLTSEQSRLRLAEQRAQHAHWQGVEHQPITPTAPLADIRLTDDDQTAHQQFLILLSEKTGQSVVW